MSRNGFRFFPKIPTLASAALIYLSLPPISHWWLAFIALIPWFRLLSTQLEQKAPRAEVFREAGWLGFLFSVSVFYWVAIVLKEFGALDWWVAITGMVLFSLFNQLQFLAFAWTLHTLHHKKFKYREALFGFFPALLLAGFDHLVPKLFADSVAHALFLSRHYRQLADIGGIACVAFLIFHTSWVLSRCLQDFPKTSLTQCLKFYRKPLAGLSLVLMLGWIYGEIRLRQVAAAVARSAREVPGAMVQPAVGDIEKLAAESGLRSATERVIENLFELSRTAFEMKPTPEFIVWPETAYPSTFRQPQTPLELTNDLRVENFARTHKIPILFGGYSSETFGDGTRDFNSLFFFDPRREPGLNGRDDLEVYQKHHLLLFGETIPGADWFPAIKKAFPQVGYFGRGVGPRSIALTTASGPLKMSPIICYEALFPKYSIQGAKLGAQMILNITNDSWFGTYGEPHLHLAVSIFRSIETRLPQVRSTNTGISAVVSADGELVHATEIGARLVQPFIVPITEPISTPIQVLGDWFGTTALILCAATIAVQLARTQNRRKQSGSPAK